MQILSAIMERVVPVSGIALKPKLFLVNVEIADRGETSICMRGVAALRSTRQSEVEAELALSAEFADAEACFELAFDFVSAICTELDETGASLKHTLARWPTRLHFRQVASLPLHTAWSRNFPHL